MRRAAAVIAVAMAFLCIVGAGCARGQEERSGRPDNVLRLATSTSPVDSALLDVLLEAFTRRSGIEVEVIGRGVGAAITLAREGRADVVLAHARVRENALVMAGYGVNRVEFMSNNYVLLGPPGDPAEIRGLRDIVAGLKRIHQVRALFVSRGDGSGTNLRELSLWRLAGVTPAGPWYAQTGHGMGATLRHANERGAYVLSDRSTYLFNRERLQLTPMVEGDKRLLNVYGVTLVNPMRSPEVNFPAAMALLEFLVSDEGQQIIREYGREKFGEPLFVPLLIP